MTNSKFWKEISDEVQEETDEDCQDALVWDTKNHKPPSVYLYIVMQLCQKESLRSWLRNNSGRRNRLQCLSMFNEICTGVEYVHNQDVIHRDLKPSNIFFANDGTIKLGDFGLATAGNNPEDLSDIQYDDNGKKLFFSSLLSPCGARGALGSKIANLLNLVAHSENFIFFIHNIASSLFVARLACVKFFKIVFYCS